MEKYLKALENLSKKFGSEWIKPAAEAVIELALQEYWAGTLTSEDYAKVCNAYVKTLNRDYQ